MQRGPAFDPIELQDLLANTKADVEHLDRTWSLTTDPHALRREAVTLRRLLTGPGGGDLVRLWQWSGRSGQPKIPGAYDLNRFPHFRGLGFATGAPVNLDGIELSALLLWRVEMVTPEIEAVMNNNEPDPDLTIAQYMNAICIVLNERPVRRSDLISYVANARGSAHSGKKRQGDPRTVAAHQVLDELRGARVDQQEAAFAQMIAIARDVVTSPDIRALIATP